MISVSTLKGFRVLISGSEVAYPAMDYFVFDGHPCILFALSDVSIGYIPDALYDLTALESLDLSENQLRGECRFHTRGCTRGILWPAPGP